MANDIEIGVLVVAVPETPKKLDENVVCCGRVIRGLPHSKTASTIPVRFIGLGE